MLRTWLAFLAISATTPAFPFPVIGIQEVFYDAAGADAPHVFTEIFGPPGLRLDGWTLVGIDGGSGLPYRTIELTGAVLPADGILLLATARAVGELLMLRDFVADVDWQNGPDAIVLRNAWGEVADALQYGDAGGRRLGEGSPAPDAPPGFSLTRDERSTDTGDNARDFTVAAPTPGRRGLPAPEPPTALLWLAGIAALAGLRRLRLVTDAVDHVGAVVGDQE